MTCLHLVTIVSVRSDSWKYFCSAFKSYHRKPIYRDFFTPSKKLCLAAHKLRKGEGLVPHLFSALIPLKIFTMDILIIIHMELSIADILENTPVNNYCYPYSHFTFSRFICHREPVSLSFHRTANGAVRPPFLLRPRQCLHSGQPF